MTKCQRIDAMSTTPDKKICEADLFEFHTGPIHNAYRPRHAVADGSPFNQRLNQQNRNRSDHDPLGIFPIFPQHTPRIPVPIDQDSRRFSRGFPQNPKKSIFRRTPVAAGILNAGRNVKTGFKRGHPADSIQPVDPCQLTLKRPCAKAAALLSRTCEGFSAA